MFKFNEDDYLHEIAEYISSTYDNDYHYNQSKIQTNEFISDNGHGVGFDIGNMLKYTQRYGKKGGPDDWRKDIMKVIHYSILLLHEHDKIHSE